MKTLTITIAVLMFIVSPVFAQIIHVPGDQPTIQAGIDAASNGDTVLVADGAYFENINFQGKAITVASNFLMDGDTMHITNTIIDGSQPSHPDSASVVYFISDEDTTSIIQGFTITGGKGTYLPTTRRGGGGILCYYSGAKIMNNYIERDTIVNNLAGVNLRGGGLYYFADNDWDDYLVIKDNKFRWNYLKNTAADKDASGSAFTIACDATITGNEITNNHAESNSVKAAFFCISPPVSCKVLVSNNTISHNKSLGVGSNSSAYGSAMYLIGVFGQVNNNVIMHNEQSSQSTCGGAISAWKTDTSLVIENNIIAHNYFSNAQTCRGGGINLIWSTAKIVNNLIYNNSATNGGGISILDTSKCETIIINNTIVQNSADIGGGIYNYKDSCIVLNSIIYDNSAYYGPAIFNDNSFSSVNYSNIQGGWTGIGNIDADPGFIDPTIGNYCIDSCVNAPCAGTGTDSMYIDNYGWCYSPDYDIRNLPRPLPASTPPDMGAYEVDWCVGIDDLQSPIFDFRITNYPNPFSSFTTIEYDLLQFGTVEISILNQFGQEVDKISQHGQKGTNRLTWDAGSLPAGIYVFRIMAGNRTGTRKMVKR